MYGQLYISLMPVVTQLPLSQNPPCRLNPAGDDEACAACESEQPPHHHHQQHPSPLHQERQALLARAAELQAERDTCQAAAAEAAGLRDAAAARAAEIEAQLRGGLPARRQQLQQEREVGARRRAAAAQSGCVDCFSLLLGTSAIRASRIAYHSSPSNAAGGMCRSLSCRCFTLLPGCLPVCGSTHANEGVLVMAQHGGVLACLPACLPAYLTT
jgi:hypothetical protein